MQRLDSSRLKNDSSLFRFDTREALTTQEIIDRRLMQPSSEAIHRDFLTPRNFVAGCPELRRSNGLSAGANRWPI